MRLSLIAILVCHLAKASAQPQTALLLRFQHLNENNGLSNNVVNTIFQDSRGFMWIGTANGLNLFDGSSFTDFRHSSIDTFSISGNDIFSISEDTRNQIWVSTQCTGLSIFNAFNKRSHNYNEAGSMSEMCDIHVSLDDRNRMWESTRKKISLLDTNGRPFKEYSVFSSYENNQIYNFAIYREKIWIGHMKGLKMFDISSGSITSFDQWVDSSVCTNVRIDKNGNLLICTWQNGFYVFDPITKKRKNFLNGIIANDVAEISFKGHDQLWVATNNGLFVAELTSDIFALGNADFRKYTHDKGNAFSLSSNEVKCLRKIDDGILWVGTAGGIDIFNPSYLQFSSKKVTKNDKPFVTSALNDVLVEKDGKGITTYDLCYWHGSGLVQTDSNFRVKNQLIVKDDRGSSIIISSAFRGSNGYLWLATWDGLLCYDDKGKKIIKTFKKDSPGKVHLNTNKTDFVLEDDKGRFWIGTYGYGLNVLDIKNDTSYVFTADGTKGSLFNNRCDFIFEDSKKNIWITGPALQKYNEETHDFTTYRSQKGNPASLPGSITMVMEDHNHHMWLASSGGLAIFDEKQGSFQTYTTKDGLASDECDGLVEDKDGNIWLTTSGGLSSINIESRIIKTYTTNDGLVTNQLGSVIFNGNNGTVIFSLDGFNSPFITFSTKTQNSGKEIPFHFTSLSVLGADAPIDKSLESLDALRLGYEQNVFTVSFKALDYANGNNIRYACKLEGFDNDWMNLGHRNNVTYTNLDGGTYTLFVRATSAKGQWLHKQLQLKIIITPPFWKTWWFYLLLTVVLLGCIYAVFRIRLNKIRKQGEQKALIAREIAGLEMKALKAQMNPHFIFNALSSIQESIVNGQTDAASKYLGKFSNLIRTVLEFSDKKLITLEQEIRYLTLYLELESFRFDNFHFTIRTSDSADIDFIRMPPMLVQPFIENAIKHGLSHKGGEKKLCVVFTEEGDNFLKVIVDDNGIGREHAAELNLARNLSKQSVGIKITRKRLELMNEEKDLIQIRDKRNANGEPTGTEITLLIPTETTL